MVTIHPISETIRPKPIVVHLEVDPDLVTFLPKHLNPKVERLEFVLVSVAPQSIVAISLPYRAINLLKYTLGQTKKSFHLV